MINCSTSITFLDLIKGQEITALVRYIAPPIPDLFLPATPHFSKPITWDQVANERSTEKLLQLCREKIAPPKNFLLRAIIMGEKDWVQPLIDCGASPEEAFNYLTPALAWISKYPKEPLPPSLSKTPYDTEIIERKMLGHVFEIDGHTVVNNNIVPLEGFAHFYFWNRITEITKEIGHRNQTLSKINRLPLFENAVSLSDEEEIDFKKSPIHIIKTGDSGSKDGSMAGHVSALVLSENFIAHVSDGVSVGRYISSLLPKKIKKSISTPSLKEDSYKAAVKSLYKTTQAKPMSQIPFLQKRPLTQSIGNCAWKTPESTLFAVRLIDTLEALHAEGSKTAQEILHDCQSKASAMSDPRDEEATLLKQKCEDDVNSFMTRFVENRGAARLSELLQDHQHLIEKIKKLVFEKYSLYRQNLSDEIKLKIPEDPDLMTKITNRSKTTIVL